MMEIIMPQFGETPQEEIRIVKWLKAVGDEVHAGDKLLEVETEKATVEIEAVESGTLVKIVKSEGEAAKPGEIIGHL